LNPDKEGGSSQPHVFDTPAGSFLVKAQNNPQGLRVLSNELVGGLCLNYLGVDHPQPAIVNLPDEILKGSPGAVFADGTPIGAGSAFGSELWQSDPQGVVDVSLIENLDVVAGTLALDTWLQPLDGRQYRVRPSPTTLDRYEFIPVDQGHMIGGPEWDKASLAAAPEPAVPSTEFALTQQDVAPFIERLESFSLNDAREIVEQVPDDWLDKESREALVAYLVERAPKAAAALKARYPEDQEGAAA
jgi:hypothetical protein